MTYDPNGFPTAALPPVDPNASLNNPETDVCAIPNAQSASEVYQSNQVGFCKTLLIDRVINIIIKMINVIQQAAAAQANRINFLTEWQKAYTDRMNQVHTFAVDNGDTFDTSDDSDLINNLNQTNATFTTQETNRRSVISDDAKSLQTSLNQTSDAVNAQSSLATSFLQELSTLLAVIYRSS